MTTYTYPGVYIEEVKSQVHTITGVATSLALFIGWASKGPTDRAGLVLSSTDFERMYGGLNKDSLLGYAVQHFFANGGGTAYVVRLADFASGTPATLATTNLSDGAVDVLQVDARNVGQWGRSITITTRQRAAPNSSRFRLVATYTDSSGRVTTETFENLSMDPADSQQQYVQSVINNTSQLINVTVLGAPPVPNPPADVTAAPLATNGADGNLLVRNTSAFESALSILGSGVYPLLDVIDLFNLLVVPGETNAAVIAVLESYCVTRRAMMIVDAASTDTLTTLQTGPNTTLVSPNGNNAAFYFPWLTAADPLDGNRPRSFPPSGFIAGAYARIDASRGVWKAPAGIEAGLAGVTDVAVKLTDDQNGVLNPLGINCIRSFPIYGIVNWGARTLVGADEIGSEWKYVPVRRMALFLEESLYRGTKWVVFEPNDEPLWSQIRLNLTAFMMSLFRQGAFQGTKPSDAFFVKCDKDTTTQDDINKGIVNILVGFAPLKPAEFVVIKLSQIAGQVV